MTLPEGATPSSQGQLPPVVASAASALASVLLPSPSKIVTYHELNRIQGGRGLRLPPRRLLSSSGRRRFSLAATAQPQQSSPSSKAR
jgi:hypothetical protein